MKTNIQTLITKVKEYLYLEDITLLKLVLAVMISRTQQHAKLWLTIIGQSGDGKTELLKLFDDEGKTTKELKNITSKTLISGQKGAKDLAPTLHNKIILMPEMAEILSLHQEERKAVMAQFRNLYDGELQRATGNGLDKSYNNLNVGFIGCSTPAIDNHLLIHQDLGTREMLYRTKTKNSHYLMERIIHNTTINKNEKRNEIKYYIKSFLEEHPYQHNDLSDHAHNTIKLWALTIAKLRATGNINYSNGELTNQPNVEQPTRILEQFIVLYRCLASLSSTYDEQEILALIKDIVLSSAHPLRIKTLFSLLAKNASVKGFTSRDVATELRIGKNTAVAQLNMLFALELINRKDILLNEETERYRYEYSINKDNEIICFLAEQFNITLHEHTTLGEGNQTNWTTKHNN